MFGIDKNKKKTGTLLPHPHFHPTKFIHLIYLELITYINERRDIFPHRGLE